MVGNKRGMFFGLYLVVVTLILCGVAFGIRYQQGQNLPDELISPTVVLNVVDGLSVFEMREMNLINKAAATVNFGSGGFEDDFRNNFLALVKADAKMTEFILWDLTVNGQPISFENRAMSFLASGFFENTLYPSRLTSKKGKSVIFGRDRVGKKFVSETPNEDKHFFPAEFTFEFEKTYEVKKVNGKVEVTVV